VVRVLGAAQGKGKEGKSRRVYLLIKDLWGREVGGYAQRMAKERIPKKFRGYWGKGVCSEIRSKGEAVGGEAGLKKIAPVLFLFFECFKKGG